MESQLHTRLLNNKDRKQTWFPTFKAQQKRQLSKNYSVWEVQRKGKLEDEKVVMKPF